MMRTALLIVAILVGARFHWAEAASYVVAVPANLSPAANDQASMLFAGLYDRLLPGDEVIVIDASHLTRVADVTVPIDLDQGKKARARALSAGYGGINAFISGEDTTVPADNLNIPRLLREIGLNVLPYLRDRKAHVLLVGSVIWDNPKDGTFTFRDVVPSDGFLTSPGDVFSTAGQETVLSGSLVSICFTDTLGDFQWDGFRDQIVSFWGKSIVGRGGQVGAIQPAAANCVDRLLDPTPSHQIFTIDRTERLFLRKVHTESVEVR